MTSLKTSIKTITYLSDIGCLEIQGASLQDYPRSGLIRQAVRHTGHSVQTSLVTTFKYSVPLSGALFRHMCPYPGLFRITASFSPCPVVHIHLDKNALSEKMSKFFFW